MLQEHTELLDLLASYTHDAYGYTLACFPWGEGELETSSGPRAWQADILKPSAIILRIQRRATSLPATASANRL